LYERARTALVGQLRNMNPPLTESEITRERLALEEAIRKVEAEAARRLRMEPPRPDTLSGIRPGEAQQELARRAAAPPPPPPSPPPGGPPPPPPPPPPSPPPLPPPQQGDDDVSGPREDDEGEPLPPERAPEPPPPPPRGRNRVFGDRPPLTDEGLR